MPRIQVIIPNWNGRHLLPHCLSALAVQTIKDFDVTVVDNGSTDGSVTWLQEHFPHVHLIANSENRGFAAAIDQGIRAGDSEYIATLNNDAKPEPRWLQALVEAADQNVRVGMCASKMLFADRPWLINSTGICVDRAGIAWDRHGGRPDGPQQEDSPTEVFGPCAGAALYRRAMLDEIGLFDEDFFAYLEDVDLAWRAQWAGWECLYVPGAVVFHAHSATGKEGSSFKNHLLGRNKVWLVCKNYPLPQLLWYAPLILAYDLMSVVYSVTAGRGQGAVQGRLEALGKIPRMLAKRRQMVRRISARAMMAKLHKVESPLAVLRRYAHIRAAKGARM